MSSAMKPHNSLNRAEQLNDLQSLIDEGCSVYEQKDSFWV